MEQLKKRIEAELAVCRDLMRDADETGINMLSAWEAAHRDHNLKDVMEWITEIEQQEHADTIQWAKDNEK